jgi:hypothetical protein
LEYYIVLVLTILGGLLLVLLLHRFDPIMRKPAPQWIPAIPGLLVPAAICFGVPPLP